MVVDILVPPEQEGTKAVVRGWLKQLGDTVALDEPLVELDTDKVSHEIGAPAAGTLVEILLKPDDEAMPGTVLGRLRQVDTAEVPTSAADKAPTPPEGPTTAAAAANAGWLSPAVRRAVTEHDVDPAALQGTGRGGRLTRADIDRHVAARDTSPVSIKTQAGPLASTDPTPAPAASHQAAAADAREPSSVRAPRSHHVPHDGMRLAIAENMLRSVTVAPHVTAVFEADLSAIMAHRRRHRAAFERDGVNLTYTAYMVAAAVEAMRAAPAVNSRWHADRLELFEDVNVGVGAALGDKGLVVPVVHRAQELSLRGVATRLGEMVGRARADRLTPADTRGGTFTISNHGVSGSLFASPIIIPQPQSAILGVGALEKRVVVREVDGADAIQIRPMAYVSLTIDHRVVDGHQTNSWLSRFVEVLQSWPT